MNDAQLLNQRSLELALDFHRIHENGMAVAQTQRHQIPEKANASAVVTTAAIFAAFLKGA
jgi:predicted deacylase